MKVIHKDSNYLKKNIPTKVDTPAAAPGSTAPQQGGQGESVLRVAAYCRVSTDSDEQETSYEAQCTYYERYITTHEGWVLAGIFADEGITGTMAKKRPRFLEMIEACKAHQIDMILTKSISRFSRNTLDCLRYVRLLKELKIPIIFEKESIDTRHTSGEVMLTILSSLAQQESQSISENVKMGLDYNARQGKGQLNITHFLGYDRGDEPHTMVINPQQAEVVRRIYREYLEGFTPWTIAKRLEKDGVPTATGKTGWHRSTIVSILKNEKYAGDLLIQKYVTTDFLTHKQVKNIGQRPQYHVENHHEPIIPKSIYYHVQGEIFRRHTLRQEPRAVRHNDTNALSSRLICCRCGTPLKHQPRKDGAVQQWRCTNRKRLSPNEALACDLRIIDEVEVTDAVLEAFDQLARRYEHLLQLHAQVSTGEIKKIDTLLDDLEEDITELQQKLEEGSGVSVDERGFFRQQLERLDTKKMKLFAERAVKANQEVSIRVLIKFVKQLVRRRDPLLRYAQEYPPAEAFEKPAACYDADDFYERTAYIIPNEDFNGRGQLIRYNNDLVARYIDHIEVLDDGFDIFFRAGFDIIV